ncbi:hypothetical protein [Actinomyces weissii]|uniref:hypothetical protein n=1 Tax=Actinomyces weissii TaxID=675090 RepID=UPI001F1A3B24|nr:hypothetical protein [Actinomyces weissii]
MPPMKSPKSARPQATGREPEAAAPASPVQEGPETAQAGPAAGSSRLDLLCDRLSGHCDRLASTVAASSLGRWWTATAAPGRVDWALLTVLLAVAYVIFLYGDVRATFEHSFNFLDAVLSGRPRDFYTISIQNTSTGHPAVYDIPLYAVFALWNLPTYVLYKLTGYEYLVSTPAQLWLKTMMVVAAVACAKVLADLARDLGVGRERAKWVAFYFLSSMAVFMPVFVVVQYDIVLVLTVLLGMRAYVRGDLRRFLLWFMLANTLKLFAVFIFIPLLLLREKRLRVVVGQLVAGMVPLALCRLLYRGDAGYAAATSGFTDGMMDRLVATHIGWIGGGAPIMSIPLFVVFMVCLTVFAYAKRPVDDLERNAVAIYLCLAVYAVFMAVVPLNPYWVVLMSPFAVLMVFLNPRHLVLNTLLEMVVSGGVVMLYTRIGYSMYNRAIFEQLLLPHLTAGAEYPRYPTPNDVLIDKGLGGGTPFIIGVLVAAVASFLVLNYPGRGFLEQMGNLERLPRSVAWTRLLAPLGFAGLLLVTYFVPAVPVVYTSAHAAPTAGEGNLLAPGAELSETFQLEQSTETESIGVGFMASTVLWIDSSTITVSLSDSSGRQVFTTTMPANSLGDKVTQLPTSGLLLEAGTPYTLRITSQNTEGGLARVQINPDLDRNRTTYNGAEVPGDLVLVVSGTVR